MSEARDDESVSIESARELDRLCDQFETEWRRNRSPSIADALQAAESKYRTQLFQMLLERDLEYRQRTGPVPDAASYVAQFPEYGDIIARVFSNRAVDSPGAASGPTADHTDICESPGSLIGPYKLLQEIGHGGMGVVYMAEQIHPVNRRVALKIIKPGMDTKEVIARFEAERQALALMEHPNIARVLDAGATEAGRPYFVMELVKGVSITEYCDRSELDTRQRLDLFVSVCRAVQHAHQKGIIHRDLKPSNVMVTLHDGVPVPKVIDFGIAKATIQRLTEKTLFTAYGQFIGTAQYMSPEQSEMSGLDVDTRSDIYSLGALLYELLTGSPPFDSERLRSAGFAEIVRIVRDEEPPKPSARLSTLGNQLATAARHRHTEPEKLRRSLQGDLDWIVMKALEKDRGRRYETANGLASDIERHLHDEAVQARPPSSLYRFQKMARRNRAAVAVTAAMIIALVGGLAFATWGYFEANRQRQIAVDLREEAVDAREEAVRRGTVARNRLTIMTARSLTKTRPHEALLSLREIPTDAQSEIAARALNATHEALQASPILAERRLLGHTDAVWHAAWSPEGKRIVTASADKTARVWNADGTGVPIVLAGQTDQVRHAAWSPDGKRIVMASYDGTAQVWNADGTGKPIVLAGHTDAVWHVAWSPDGKRVVTASDDKTARVWSADGTGKPVVLVGHTDSVHRAAWSPDGKRIATASYDFTARVWKADGTGEPIVLDGHQHKVWSAAWSPDGKRVVTAAWDKTARVWNADGTGKPIILAGKGWNLAVWSPDGKHIVTAANSGKAPAHVWNADGKGAPIILAGHTEGVWSAAWSPDGKRIVTASRDFTARMWNADGVGAPIVLTGHAATLRCVAWSPDGKRIVTASDDHTARVWNVGGTGSPIILSGHLSDVTCAAWSPDGKRIVMASDDHTARVRNADGTGEPIVLSGHTERVGRAVWSPDGKRIVTASEDDTARVWKADGSGVPNVLTGHTRSVITVAWSPDGKRVVTGSYDLTARVWNADGTGEPIVLPGRTGRVAHAVWSPDGKYIVTTGWGDKTAQVWNADGTGEPIILTGHKTGVMGAMWSPDGKRIVTASWDKTARVWNADGTGVPIVLTGHTERLGRAVWSPDGKRIVTTSWDRTARVWNADSTGEPIILAGHTDKVCEAAWSPDGKRIITSSLDHTARVWNADGTGDPIVFPWPTDDVYYVALSPDGKRLITTSSDGTARVWTINDWPQTRASLWKRIPDIFTPEERIQYLSETLEEAEAAVAN